MSFQPSGAAIPVHRVFASVQAISGSAMHDHAENQPGPAADRLVNLSFQRLPGARVIKARGSVKPRALKSYMAGLLVVAVLAVWPASAVFAQQAVDSVASDRGLPDAPGMEAPFSSSVPEPLAVKPSAGISGTVMDTNGNIIAGAQVTLAGTIERTMISGDNGQFDFSELPPGSFKLTVTGPGMGSVIVSGIMLLPGEFRILPKIALPIAATDTEVRVVADQEQLAEEQIHLEMQQRVLGILPSFYTSYDWHAVPLAPKQKFELAFRATTDPFAFAGAAFLASFEQANNSFPGYGQGVQGYAKRFGSAYANDFFGRMLGSALLPSLFHQDPRYFYKGSGSIRSRALYAMGSAIICRGDNGRMQPNYSHFFGTMAAGALSNLYYPAASRGVSLAFLNGLIETAGNAGNNLLREFLLKRLTSNVPVY
jgi:hypothetical protein